MDTEKLLLAEYEAARSAHRETKASVDKYLALFATILIALLTFIGKGDLHNEAYIICAIVLYIGAAYISAISYKATCLAGVLKISERKLNKWAFSQKPDVVVFDLMSRYSCLHGKSHLHRNLLIGSLSILYVIFVVKGLSAFVRTWIAWILSLYVAIPLVLILAFCITVQHKRMKTRFRELDMSSEEVMQTGRVPLAPCSEHPDIENSR